MSSDDATTGTIAAPVPPATGGVPAGRLFAGDAGVPAWWREQLADAPALLELPTDRPRSAGRSGRAELHRFALSHAAREVAGVTLEVALLGAVSVLLAAYAGTGDVVVGIPAGGALLPLRTRLAGAPTVGALLARVREGALGVAAHADVSFARLAEGIESGAHHPIFQVAAGLGTAALDADGLDLAFGFAESGEVAIRYATDLFDAATVVRMGRHLEQVLRGMAADAERPVDLLPLLDDEERHRVLHVWNDSGAAHAGCIHQLFEAQADRTPSAEALVHGDARLTYAELDARANRLARRLRELGVGPETRVGVCLERTPELIVALLAVLKAGGAYVPLDPAYPAARIAYMVGDSGAPVVLTQRALAGRLPAGPHVVALDDADERARIDAQDGGRLEGGAEPEHLSHVIYTSGSTGQPKGVMIRHSSTAAFLHWMRTVVPDEERASVLASTSVSFDVSLAEIFGALSWGGRLVMVENALELPRAAGVRLATMVPSAAAELVRGGQVPESVQAFNLAGEALPAEVARALYGLEHVRYVRNLYGPTEDTTYSTYSLVPRDAERVLIGRPKAGSRAYVLDAMLNPAPVGVPGELYLAGAGLARGYLGKPGMTAEKFLPDPYSAEPGARMYRTMDRARWRESGELEYLGRADSQVKVRGFRVELGEVESALRSHPAVADGAVLLRDGRLVGYVVGEVSAAELRAHLGERLPEYMVPGALVVMDAFPQTPSGKLDRRALPEPAADEAGYVAPRTPAEEMVAGVLSEVLGVARVGAADDFFALGGHSLLAARVLSRLRGAFGVELPSASLFEAPTVAALARAVERSLRAESAAPPLVPVERGGPLPLSFAQRRLWLIDQVERGSAMYNIPLALSLAGALDADALARALGEIVRRHEALRTRFATVDGEPVQVIGEAAEVPLARVDAADEGRFREVADAEAARPFDLEAGPLLRAVLVRRAPGRHVLLITVHHVAADGWSLGVLWRELGALYAAFARGLPSPLEPLGIQYADFAAWQRAWLEGGVLDGQLAWWRERMEGAPALLELPTDRPRPAALSHRGAVHRFALEPAVAAGVRDLARREGVTLYMALLAGVQALLAAYTGSDDVVVGSPVAARTRPETEELIGFFVNTLVMRTDLSGAPTVRELLARVRRAALGAYAHQDVPFERLVEELRPARTLAYHPLFQVMLALQDAEPAALGEVQVEELRAATATSKFDLFIEFEERGSGLEASLHYATDLFDAATIERAGRHLQQVLRGMAEDADRPVAAIPLLDDAGRRQVVDEWNRTELPFAADICLHDAIAARAALAPDTPAVVAPDGELTFAELDALGNRLARRLQRLGVGPEARVGLLLERSVATVAAVVGTWKAGGAYVPLDPASPPERIAALLDDAGIRVVVTQARLAASLPPGVAVVRLDEGVDEDASPVEAGTGPLNAAYVIYTSGSTGAPKGVVVQHRSAMNLAAALEHAVYGREAPTRVSMNGPYTFDTSVKQLVQLVHGRTLHVIPEEARYDAAALAEVLRRGGVQVLDCTPAQLRLLLAGGLLRDGGLALTDVLVAGEAIDEALWAELAGSERPVFHNLYGPTECTVDASLCQIRSAGPVPVIGRAVANARLYVLGSALQPLPVGMAGELYVGGAGVARGYLGRAGMTAEKFLPDPFAPAPGARMYATGDRARRRADGSVEYLGRADYQVKVRGFRIEPGEVEAALLSHPAVRQAVVVALDDGESKRLVGYVAGSGAAPDELRAHLAARLPGYMVPSALVALDALPLTRNGKIDRRALPAPPAPSGGTDAPRTPTEEVLAGIWAGVLRVDAVGVRDDFFALGGHSLLVTAVTARIRGALGVELPPRALFEAPTVAQLARRVDAALTDGGARQAPALVPVDRSGPLPLSFAQARLWFIEQMDPGSPLYHVPSGMRLAGALDVAALERAVAEVVRRHEALRTVIRHEGGEPVQVVMHDTAPEWRVVDLTGRDEEAETRREAARPFDLARGPLLRACLLRLGAEEHVLLLTVHHIAVDGWSLAVVWRELEALYGAFRAGLPSPLAPVAVQYADFAVWQRGWLADGVLEAQLAYWRERLAGAPPLLELPTDHARPAAESHRGASVPLRIPAGIAAGVRELARREGVTLHMALLAGLQAVLAAYAGTRDVSVGTPVAGRTRLETEEMVGLFVNTLVVRTDLSGAPTVRELLARVREATLGAYAHQDVPFDRLVEELAPGRSLAHHPLFQVMFVLQNAGAARWSLDGMDTRRTRPELDVAKFDLYLELEEEGGELRGMMQYATDLFDAATVQRMGRHLEQVLRAMAADAERPVALLPLLDDEERHLVLHAWNDSGAAHTGCIHQLFEAQADRTPSAEALVHGDAHLTYAELDARANRLARRLRELGVGPETRVGVCLERTPELIVALLAVLKAGGAYVPLDPAYPAARIAYMVGDSGAPVVLTQSALAGRLPAGPHLVALDDAGERARIDAQDGGRLEGGAEPEHLSHVIYTSGSTGQPKGVMIRHSSTTAFLHWMRTVVPDEERVSVLASTSVSFDVSLAEIFGALSWGGRLVMVENALELPRAAGVRLATMVPSAAAELVRGGQVPASVQAFNLAGEALPAEVARALYGLEHVRYVRNLYGPTEDTTYSTYSLVPRDAERVLIGRPKAGSRAYVLDAMLNPAPVGVPGELYLAGAGLARGYLGKAGMTAEKFLPDPYAAEPGARMYRTMDRARWREIGELEYLGRADSQVKVRGFRVELGEVESALRSHPAVADAAVLLREERLVGYVVGEVSAAELRAHLGERLPEYMVPGALVVMDAFPQTPSGKLDRRALPAPEPAAEEDFVAPRTPAEEIVAGIWGEVLGLARVGAADDFFALGGHSLLAVRILSRLREAFGVELPLRALFEAPTVAALAARVEGALRTGAAAPGPRIGRRAAAGPVPLSFAQARLWFVQEINPGSPLYHIPDAMRLRGPLDAAVLERALAEVVNRHDALRTRFTTVDGEPVQEAVAGAAVPLRVLDLSHLPPAARGEAAAEHARREARAPFDLGAGTPLRASLVRLEAEEHLLLLTVHHIAADGWSLGIVWREMEALYGAFLRGLPSPLAGPAVRYTDFAAWERERLEGGALDAQLGWWRERLAGIPAALELPADRPRPPVPSHRGGVHRVALPAELAEGVLALARREGVTVYMAILAALQAVLSAWAGTDDVVVGSPVAGRTRLETEGVVGLFINTVAIRTSLAGRPTVRELLGRVREAALGAHANQEVPFERLVEVLAPERSLSRHPLFQVMFSLHDLPPAPVAAPGLAWTPAENDSGSVKVDLVVNAFHSARALELELRYATDLFEESTAGRLADSLRTVLAAMATDSAAPLAALPLLPEPERERVVEEWNRTEREIPGERCIHRRFEARVRETPDAPALAYEGTVLSYAELNRRANGLAHRLVALGVGPDVPVGLCTERSAETVVGMLGILKAGGAYLPIDPALPAARMDAMLRSAAARVLVAQPGVAQGAGGVRVELHPGLHDERDDDPVTRVDGANLVYVLFTSGSTGTPKGVAVEHRQLTHYVAAVEPRLGLPADASYATVSTFAADLGNTVVFPALAGGGCLHMISADRLGDAAALGEYFTRHGVDCLKIVPSHLGALLAGAPGGGVLPRRRLVLGGEACGWELVDEVRARAPQCAVTNHYGPTETTVGVLTRAVAPGERGPAGGTLPLGRPLDNTRIYILDTLGRPVPPGVPGEIHVGGEGVTRGYLGAPAATAERYVPDPFAPAPGARMYRTGDRGRWRAEGEVEFLGRVDDQVKIRGFRVEPGEVRAILATHPALREAAVVARDDGGERRLVAYVAGDRVEVAALREYLEARLPSHMVPAAWVVLDALPLSPNGKVDRRALPAPGAPERETGYVEPRTDAERTIAAVWAEVLGVERVGIHDSFWELGGHSLKAMRLMPRLAAALGVELPLRLLFEAPTVAALAERARGAAPGGTEAPIPRVPRGGPLPLAVAQQRIWMREQIDGQGDGIVVAQRISGPVDSAALAGALRFVVARHEVLRTAVRSVDGTPRQVVLPPGELALPVVDLTGHADAEAELERRVKAYYSLPLRSATPLLLQAELVRMGADDHALLVAVHHIAFDGWSIQLLLSEVERAYAALLRGAAPQLPELAIQYADYAAWQRALLEGGGREVHVAHWLRRVAGAPVLSGRLGDRAGEAGPAQGERVALGAEVSRAIHERSREAGTTPFMWLLTLYGVLLGARAGEDDVTVVTHHAGRRRVETEGLIGCFAGMWPLRMELGGDPGFRGAVLGLRDSMLEDEAHQDLPVETLRVGETNADPRLFEIQFGYRADRRPGLRLEGAAGEWIEVDAHTHTRGVGLDLHEGPEGIEGAFTYTAAAFPPATVAALARGFERLAAETAARPDARLGELRRLLAEAREQELASAASQRLRRVTRRPVQ